MIELNLNKFLQILWNYTQNIKNSIWEIFNKLKVKLNICKIKNILYINKKIIQIKLKV